MRRGIRDVRAGLVVAALVMLTPPPASAAPALVTIDSREAALANKDGGGWTASLTFTNLTDGELTLTVRAADATDAGCGPTLDKNELAPAQRTAVTVTIPAGCEVGDDGIDLVVVATATPDAATTTFEVTAAPKPDEAVDWSPLAVFPILLAVLVGVVVAVCVFWDAPDESGKNTGGVPLKQLDATWSFSESWAGNVTVAAGLLTGVLGSSSVVKALLGDDAERSVALATVGAAVAAAFVAAGPVVLAIFRSGPHPTVGGFLLASALVMTGAGGELFVVYSSGRQLDLGGWEDKLYIAAAGAAALLLTYAVTAVRRVLRDGTKKPEPKSTTPSDTIRAAEMIVAALKASADVDEARVDTLMAEMADAYPDPAMGTSPGDEPPARRAAVL